MLNKDKAKLIRKELKEELGLTSRQVSVRTSGSAIRCEIKDLNVSKREVEEVANKQEHYRKDFATGEILLGGNTFINVVYNWNIVKEESQKYKELIEKKVNGTDSNHIKLAESKDGKAEAIYNRDFDQIETWVSVPGRDEDWKSMSKRYLASNIDNMAQVIVELMANYKMEII